MTEHRGRVIREAFDSPFVGDAGEVPAAPAPKKKRPAAKRKAAAKKSGGKKRSR